jgi:hypothetical protein
MNRQNDSPVSKHSSAMNTRGSLDSPVVNTPRSLNSPLVNTPGNLDSPVMNTPGSWHLGVLWTRIRICLQKKLLNRLPCVLIIGESLLPGVFCTNRYFCKPIKVDSPVYSSLGRLDSLGMITPASHDSPVMNTPASHDSPVVNTLASLDSSLVHTPGSRLRIRITPQIL